MTEENASTIKTRYFDSCRAVFQGGGCRGVALAGAYQAAYDAGVFFAEVAGTSAGSIMAALIGAGATPDFVEKELRALDFCKLLRKPTRKDGSASQTVRVLGWLAAPVFTKFSQIARFGGMYSSEGVEEWVDERLAQLLPNASRPVRFRDLLRPTYIVATHLDTKSVRVWSKEKTPDDIVAFAVRASCSIPLFFQPVVQGSGRLVDGGVLSNLPAFVFDTRAGGRILAFRLVEEFESPASWTPETVVKRFIDTMVSGATELQIELQQSVHTIDIPTGDIGATDFEAMTDTTVDKLFESGRTKTREFIAAESLNVRAGASDEDVVLDEDQLHAALVQMSETPAEQIVISDPSTEWFWKLFPTVFHWRRQGIRVRVITSREAGNDRERARERTRRANLEGLGVELVCVEDLPMRAYLFVRNDANASSAVVGWQNRGSHSPLATQYSGPAHQQAIRGIQDTLQGYLPSADSIDFVPSLEPMDSEGLLEMLRKGVAQYASSDVALSIENVEVARVRTITKLVRAYKYRQVVRLVDVYRACGLELFEPAVATLKDGGESVVAPPVVEERGGELIGIEGNTRTSYCWRNGIETMRCIVVRNASAALPGTGVSLNEVRIVHVHYSPGERMPGFDHDEFRRIEGAVHPLL